MALCLRVDPLAKPPSHRAQTTHLLKHKIGLCTTLTGKLSNGTGDPRKSHGLPSSLPASPVSHLWSLFQLPEGAGISRLRAGLPGEGLHVKAILARSCSDIRDKEIRKTILYQYLLHMKQILCGYRPSVQTHTHTQSVCTVHRTNS